MAQANGKIILLGEHAVVHGFDAIAVGIERGARAHAQVAAPARLQLGHLSAVAGDGSELSTAYEALLTELALGPHHVQVELELPPGAGLGASAALGVVIARAVLELHPRAGSSARVLAAAGAWERVFHGNPSGIDVAAAERGGCLLFSRSQGVRVIPVARELSLVVALAGAPASTRQMVEQVQQQLDTRGEIVQKTLEAIGALVVNARLCIESGDLPGLGQLMNLNQMLLAGLFLSTEGIERACAVARAAGALGAKLTGAGGGGAVVALSAGDPESLLSAFHAAGLPCFATRVLPSSGGLAP
ncbi:MAG TPA: mevalonate kinase [Polyangiaceae bacterium]|nr:mevalonate kinase [Polyangiaceae bacterium]